MYPFTVNGNDFSKLVNKYGISEKTDPVIGGSVTDLDGVVHTGVRRYIKTISVTLNPLTDEDAKSLCTELTKSRVSVTYLSPTLGRMHTLTAQPMSQEASVGLVNGAKRHWLGGTLTIQEA